MISVEDCLALIRKQSDSLPAGAWFQGVGYDDIKLADMVILDRDVFTVPVEEVKEVRADMTIVDGVVRYHR